MQNTEKLDSFFKQIDKVQQTIDLLDEAIFTDLIQVANFNQFDVFDYSQTKVEHKARLLREWLERYGKDLDEVRKTITTKASRLKTKQR